MAPLNDLEGLLRTPDQDRGTQLGGKGRRACCRLELAPVQPLPLGHGPTLHWLKESGLGCRAFTASAPDTRYPAPSQRVQDAQRVLVRGAHACAPPRDRPEILEPERVAAGPEPDQCVGVVTQLAEQRHAILLLELRGVRLVHAVVEPEAPVGREAVTGLGPPPPAPVSPCRAAA